MATAAQKLAKANKVTKVPSCTIKLGKEKFSGTPALGKLVQEGFDLKQEMDVLKAKLDAVNKKISDKMRDGYLDGTGTVHVEAGGVKCSVALRESVSITDPDSLLGLLGARFNDLVKVSTSYKPERKLIEMAMDADGSIENDILRGCLAAKEAKPSVTYKVV